MPRNQQNAVIPQPQEFEYVNIYFKYINTKCIHM